MSNAGSRLELIAIKQDGSFEKDGEAPTALAEVIPAMTALYSAVGYEPPWLGYLAWEDNICVGMCGFKSPPQDDRVEIAYFTSPEHESRGVATEMASELVRIAFEKAPNLTVAAQTLPEENASTSILKKLQFRFVDAVEHPEDGLVWEWQLRRQGE